MTDATPGTCELCRHWDEAARREASSVRQRGVELGEDFTPYNDGSCKEVRTKMDILVYGDGYLESVDTDADFGCVLFAPLEGAT